MEITDLNLEYLKRDALSVEKMDRGFAWLDTGALDSWLEAAEFMRMLAKLVGLQVGCPEEVAFRAGWIDQRRLERLAASQDTSG